MPSVTEAVTLDGTDGAGCAGTGRLVIDGSAAGAGDGLALISGSDGSTVCGVLVRAFANDGFQVDSNNNSVLGSVANDNNLSGLIIGGGDGNTVPGEPASGRTPRAPSRSRTPSGSPCRATPRTTSSAEPVRATAT